MWIIQRHCVLSVTNSLGILFTKKERLRSISSSNVRLGLPLHLLIELQVVWSTLSDPPSSPAHLLAFCEHVQIILSDFLPFS